MRSTNNRPTIPQIRLFRWICRQININYNKCLRLQEEMDRQEMSDWIEQNHGRAKLNAMSFEEFSNGVKKMKRLTEKTALAMRRDRLRFQEGKEAKPKEEGEKEDGSRQQEG